MSDISVIVNDSNNVTALVATANNFTAVLDQGVIGPTGPQGPTGPIYGARVVTLPSTSPCTMNASTTDTAVMVYSVNAPLTIANPSGTYTNGQKLILRLTTSYAVTFNWGTTFTGSTDLNLPSGSSTGTCYMGFMYDSTANSWNLIAKVFGF
jgi:hypothetical protein